MKFETIDNIIEKINYLQKKISKYSVRQQEIQKRNPEYQLPKMFYKLRNQSEGMRIKKALLTREKNKHLSYMGFS